MARIRSVKPSIWSDQRFISLSLEARLLCIGMISNADDSGRLIASGVGLLGAVFPHDDIPARKVEKWRDEIAATGMLEVYQQGRGVYAWFPHWSRHQRIQKKQPSTLPNPVPGPRLEPIPEPPPDENGYATSSRTGSVTEGEMETERETEREGEKETAAVAAVSSGADELEASELLDACGVTMREVRDKLRPMIVEALAGGVEPLTVKVALSSWHGRGGKPGLLPHLIEEFHGKAKPRVEVLPPPCGECGPGRMVELDDDTAARCPRCHPSSLVGVS